MSLITQTTTTDPLYNKALALIVLMNMYLKPGVSSSILTNQILAFEDDMNGISGDISNLPQGCILDIQTKNSAVVATAAELNYEIILHDSVLLPVAAVATTAQTKMGKKLFPRTETIDVPAIEVASSAPVSNITTIAESEIADENDPVFAALDAIALAASLEPVGYTVLENPPLLIPEELAQLALNAAANTSGLQAGLVEFSVNPLKNIINSSISLINGYNANNYAALNTQLIFAQTSISLSSEYEEFLLALGGGDGLSGSTAQLYNFKDHTDRLSGLVLADDSDFAEPSDDSTIEDLTLNDVSGNYQQIITFSANKFRSAKYWVQASAGHEHQASEIYLIHDNNLVYTREISTVYSQDPFIELTAQLSNGAISILANTAYPNTDFVIHGTRLRIARNSDSYEKISQTKIISNAQLLADFLHDGVDYVAYQSASLLSPNLIGNLVREVSDAIAEIGSLYFTGLNVAAQQAILLKWSSSIITRNEALQSSIDMDYAAYQEVARQVEALGIAYSLTAGYQNPLSKTVLTSTLNNTVKTILNGTT